MEIKTWATGVNTRVLRDGSNWTETVGFIEDKTMSGKRKRRLAYYSEKRPFTVKMRFTFDEYLIFRNWYENVLKKGFFSFYFPKIDEPSSNTLGRYRFVADGKPQFSNPSGKLVDATMKWEEL